MDTQYFPHFCRANYKEIGNEPNEDLIELGNFFKNHLKAKFADKMDKLEPIWDISPKTVINQIGNPLKINGYHPALLLLFDNFISKNTV